MEDVILIMWSLNVLINIGVYVNSFFERKCIYVVNVLFFEICDDIIFVCYVEYVKIWVVVGVIIIGGCCGIGFEYIKVISDVFG